MSDTRRWRCRCGAEFESTVEYGTAEDVINQFRQAHAAECPYTLSPHIDALLVRMADPGDVRRMIHDHEAHVLTVEYPEPEQGDDGYWDYPLPTVILDGKLLQGELLT